MGSKPACPQGAEFVRAFDAAQVAALAHQTSKLLWKAHFLEKVDFDSLPPEHRSFQDDWIDYYLPGIETQTPWIYEKIEKNPDNARCASYFSAAVLMNNAHWVTDNIQFSRFTVDTKAALQEAMDGVNEILKFYEIKAPKP